MNTSSRRPSPFQRGRALISPTTATSAGASRGREYERSLSPQHSLASLTKKAWDLVTAADSRGPSPAQTHGRRPLSPSPTSRRPSPQHRDRDRALSPTQASLGNRAASSTAPSAAQLKYAKFLKLQMAHQQQQAQRRHQPTTINSPRFQTNQAVSSSNLGVSATTQQLTTLSQSQSQLQSSSSAAASGSRRDSVRLQDDSQNQEQQPSGLTHINATLLRKKSIRWMNLSSTFWGLVVQDAQRSVDCAALANFLEAMEWRAKGKITDAEFTVIFSEWVGGHNAQSTRRRGAIGVFAVRQMLLDRGCEENDLDLLIGMIIHETNRATQGSPISFAGAGHHKVTATRDRGLEVVTPRWLGLSEELFFALDTPGYGALRFDEVFFFSTCLVIGLQGWQTEQDLQADLSLGILAAYALQLLKEMGATVTITAHRQELLGLSISRDKDDARERSTAYLLDETAADITPLSDATLLSGRVLSPGRASISGRMVATPSFGKFTITVPMFKAFLIKRSVGEAALADLLVHVRTCVERLAHVAASTQQRNGAPSSSSSSSTPQHSALTLALHPQMLGLGDSTLGSPRLWAKAVLTAAGFDLASAPSVPPILSYLLSDADKLIPGAVRSAEGFQTRPKSAMLMSESDELHETARRVWTAFRLWGTPARGGLMSPTGSRGKSQAVDPHSDPTYQLVLSSLLEYKNLQRALCSSLVDMTMIHFGLSGAQGSVSPVCLALLPNIDTILVELGLDESEPSELEPPTSSDSPTGKSNLRQPHPHSPTYPSGNFSATAIQMQQMQAVLPAPPAPPADQPLPPPSTIYSRAASPSVGESAVSRLLPTPANNRPSSNARLPQNDPQAALPKQQRGRGALGGLATPYTPFTPYATTPATQLDTTASSIRPEYGQGAWYDDTPFHANPAAGSGSASLRPPLPPRPSTNGLPPAPASYQQQQAPQRRESVAASTPTAGAVLSAEEAKLFQSLLQARDVTAQKDLVLQLRALRGVETQSPPPPPPAPPSLPELDSTFHSKHQSYFTQRQVVAPPPPSVAPTQISESTAPSSLEDLLEMGHGAGRYAQTLREILRKMSRENNRVQLHSLEQVLKLGKQIEVLEKERVPRSRSPPMRGPTGEQQSHQHLHQQQQQQQQQPSRGARGQGLRVDIGSSSGTSSSTPAVRASSPYGNLLRGQVRASTPTPRPTPAREAWGGEKPRHHSVPRQRNAAGTPSQAPATITDNYFPQHLATRAAHGQAPGTTPMEGARTRHRSAFGTRLV